MKAFILAAFAVGGLISAPLASAETCGEHLLREGTTSDEDIAWHSVHGGESPCKRQRDENDREASSSYDGNDRWGRDDFGWHCTWHGCG